MSRWWALPALLAVVATMAWWSRLNLDGRLGWRDLVARPERRDGEAIVLSLVTVGPTRSAHRYVVFHGSLPLEIVGDSREVELGEDVTIGGTFSAAEGALIAEWVEHRPARTGKKLLGIFAIVTLGLVLPACWRPSPDGLVTRG